jgi:uracil-DNA glycosylase
VSPPFDLPPTWRDALRAELEAPYLAELAAFVAAERATKTVYPPEADVLRALTLTPLDRVRVVLIGQDPYHDEGQAHGLCFSVRAGTKPPPSLKNIFRELASDVGVATPPHGDLSVWAERGVLMLNAVLTVAAHAPGSHAGKGWERFTDAVVSAVSMRARPAVFCLWGSYAKKKAQHVDRARHEVVESGHPSPLSVKHFLGSRPFSRVNEALARLGEPAMDWSLPMEPP